MAITVPSCDTISGSGVLLPLLMLIGSVGVDNPPKPIDAASWISAQDYPIKAREIHATGTVGYLVDVNRGGRVTECHVTSSSGEPVLDHATCNLLKARARFTPPVDARGRARASSYANQVSWVLPAAPPLPAIVAVQGWRRGAFSFAPGASLGRASFPTYALPTATTGPTEPAPVAVAENDSPPADPALRTGRLSNGMRYEIMRRARAGGTVSFRLRIAAGSVDETDTERGYAHFVEHMTFRGSTHYADGEMIRTLEQMGLAMGVDTKANTMPDATVYSFDFPATKYDHPAITGLQVLRDIVDQARFAPEAVQAERGVILSEQRFRDSYGLEANEARTALLLEGQRIPIRSVGGTAASISTATSAGLQAFYKTHYRPDNAVMIVVGDIDPSVVELDIKTAFSSWNAKNVRPAPPDLGKVRHRGEQVKFSVDPGGMERVEANWTTEFQEKRDTIATERRELVDDLAETIFNDRLVHLAERTNSTFSAAVLQSDDLLRSAHVTTLAVSPLGDRSAEALGIAMEEQRRFVVSGASQWELDRATARLRANLAEAEAAARSRSTQQIADALLDAINANKVFTSPAQATADSHRILETVTLADVHTAIKGLFSGSGPLVFELANKPRDGKEEILHETLANVRATPPGPAPALVEKSWPYAGGDASGQIIKREDFSDLGVTIVRFANGTSVTVKSVPEPREQILVDLNFGSGLSGLPVGLERSYWMATATSQPFVQGGLGKASAADIADELAGKTVNTDFSVSENRFHLGGTTTRVDFQTQMELLAAYVSDPGFREEPLRQATVAMAAVPAWTDSSAMLNSGRNLPLLLHDGDRRWAAVPSAADLASGRPEDLKAILLPALAGPINVVVVGDIDVDRAIAVAQATIGALPARGARLATRPTSFPKVPPEPIEIVNHGKVDNAVAVAAWPTTDFYASMADARTMQVLAAVIRQRLLEGLRSRDGLTYSPEVSIDQSQRFRSYGALITQVEIAPEKVGQFYAELGSIMADLGQQPISPEELDRARSPLMDAVNADLMTTNYWLYALSGAEEDPRFLDTIRTRVKQITLVTPSDIQRLAMTYLGGTPYRVVFKSQPPAREVGPRVAVSSRGPEGPPSGSLRPTPDVLTGRSRRTE